MKEVIISTSSLNSYGSRVLTEGIDTTQYAKNPILLWMHQRPMGDGPLPLGHVENLRTDGDALIGTPVFDLGDSFASEIARKWEQGDLKMVSAGLEIVATSDDPADLLPGQTRPTITKSKLVEVSIVDIGANDDALQLYSDCGTMVALGAGMDCEVLPFLSYSTPTEVYMKEEILTALGLAEDASEQDVLEAVQTLKAQAEELETLRAEAEALRLSNLNALIDAAVREKRVGEGQRQTLLLIGEKAGAETLRETLSLLQPLKRPSDLITPQNGSARTRYEKLYQVPTEELEQLRTEDPQEYARLYKATYGVELPKALD